MDSALYRLLVEHFRGSDLRQILRQAGVSAALMDELPGEIASPSALAFAVVTQLEARGETAAFLSRLAQLFPAVRAAIVEVAPEISQSSATMVETTTCCRRCGVRTDNAEHGCTGLAPAHELEAFVGKVFCRDCGTPPGEMPSRCTGSRNSHDMIAALVYPRCTRCGKAAGTRSNCSGLAPRHRYPEG